MQKIFLLIVSLFVIGCNDISFMANDIVTEDEVAQFFKTHKVAGNYAAALKKSSLGQVSYLATIHGYPNNLDVCNDLIAPYNENESLSTIPGYYFCEELR